MIKGACIMLSFALFLNKGFYRDLLLFIYLLQINAFKKWICVLMEAQIRGGFNALEFCKRRILGVMYVLKSWGMVYENASDAR